MTDVIEHENRQSIVSRRLMRPLLMTAGVVLILAVFAYHRMIGQPSAETPSAEPTVVSPAH